MEVGFLRMGARCTSFRGEGMVPAARDKSRILVRVGRILNLKIYVEIGRREQMKSFCRTYF